MVNAALQMGSSLHGLPDAMSSRREQLIREAFKLLSSPSRQPVRKKPISKRDILPLVLASVGAGIATKDPGAVGKGLLSFAQTRQALSDQDYQDQQISIADENRIREVGAKEKFALADLTGDRESELRKAIMDRLNHQQRLQEIGLQNRGKMEAGALGKYQQQWGNPALDGPTRANAGKLLQLQGYAIPDEDIQAMESYVPPAMVNAKSNAAYRGIQGDAIQTKLPFQTRLMDNQASASAANAHLLNVRSSDIVATQPSRIRLNDARADAALRNAATARMRATDARRNVDSMIDYRTGQLNLAGRRITSEGLRSTFQGLGSSLTSLSSQANSIRDQIKAQQNNLAKATDPAERTRIAADITKLQGELQAVQTEYGNTASRRQVLDDAIKKGVGSTRTYQGYEYTFDGAQWVKGRKLG